MDTLWLGFTLMKEVMGVLAHDAIENNTYSQNEYVNCICCHPVRGPAPGAEWSAVPLQVSYNSFYQARGTWAAVRRDATVTLTTDAECPEKNICPLFWIEPWVISLTIVLWEKAPFTPSHQFRIWTWKITGIQWFRQFAFQMKKRAKNNTAEKSLLLSCLCWQPRLTSNKGSWGGGGVFLTFFLNRAQGQCVTVYSGAASTLSTGRMYGSGCRARRWGWPPCRGGVNCSGSSRHWSSVCLPRPGGQAGCSEEKLQKCCSPWEVSSQGGVRVPPSCHRTWNCLWGFAIRYGVRWEIMGLLTPKWKKKKRVHKKRQRRDKRDGPPKSYLHWVRIPVKAFLKFSLASSISCSWVAFSFISRRTWLLADCTME